MSAVEVDDEWRSRMSCLDSSGDRCDGESLAGAGCTTNVEAS